MDKVWQWSNFWGMLLISVWVVFSYRKRIGWLGFGLWSWVLISTIRIFMYPQEFFPGLTLRVDYTAAQAFAVAAIIPVLVLSLSQRIFAHWKKAANALLAIELVLLLTYGYGFMNANSFDGGWIMAMLPLAPGWLVISAVLVLMKTRGATAFAVAAAELFALYRFWKLPFEVPNPKRFKIALLIPGGFMFALVAFASQGMKLFNDSERLENWTRDFQFWWANHLQIQGAGIGSFQWIGPALQCPSFNPVKCAAIGFFLQMHNDWLQVLWESGVIGFGLMAIFYGQLIWKARHKPRVLASLVGVGVLALTYHPLRFFPSALWLICLVREALEIQGGKPHDCRKDQTDHGGDGYPAGSRTRFRWRDRLANQLGVGYAGKHKGTRCTAI